MPAVTLEPDAPPAPSSERETDAFRRDVLAGLGGTPKTLPSKHFYDAEGSRLFDRITELDAYYPTRTEAAILGRYGAEMTDLVAPEGGGGAVLVEYGSGSSVKTRLLLDRLPNLAAYVPLDISRAHLLATADGLRADYPALRIEPVVADYTGAFSLPPLPAARRVLFFPGSTIGNFVPDEARAFLQRMARVAGPGGTLLVGVDLRKDRATLERAYDDEQGVTAAFNRNLLVRINRELEGSFDLDAFAHRAVWNPEGDRAANSEGNRATNSGGDGEAAGETGEAAGRVEMHLVSLRAQTVRVGDHAFAFAEGETIHTENSYKYTPEGFGALARSAGWAVERVWMDDAGLFSVQALRVVR